MFVTFWTNVSKVQRMSSSVAPVVHFFQSQSEYLSNIYGVNFVQHATGAYEGWSDFTDIFVDNVVFWCTTMYYLAMNGNEIGSYVQRIRAAFSRYLDPAMFVVMYVCSGRCPDDSVIPDEFHAIKADQLNFEPGWDYVKGFIQIKVSFDEITLEMALRLLRSIHRELYDNLIIMHDLDISVDCALVSTRDIIESISPKSSRWNQRILYLIVTRSVTTVSRGYVRQLGRPLWIFGPKFTTSLSR